MDMHKTVSKGKQNTPPLSDVLKLLPEKSTFADSLFMKLSEAVDAHTNGKIGRGEFVAASRLIGERLSILSREEKENFAARVRLLEIRTFATAARLLIEDEAVGERVEIALVRKFAGTIQLEFYEIEGGRELLLKQLLRWVPEGEVASVLALAKGEELSFKDPSGKKVFVKNTGEALEREVEDVELVFENTEKPVSEKGMIGKAGAACNVLSVLWEIETVIRENVLEVAEGHDLTATMSVLKGYLR